MRESAVFLKGFMTIGRTYRHPSCTEVDLHIVQVTALNYDSCTLLVAWINRHHPHILYEDEVTVKYADMPKWERV